MYTIGLERRVYTIEASDPEKEKKEGFHSGGVHLFPSCTLLLLSGVQTSGLSNASFACHREKTSPHLGSPPPLKSSRFIALIFAISLGQKRERKFPEFCKFSSRILPRILLRIFPEFFEEFSCFVSWETETRKNSQKIPAFFQYQISRQTRKKYSQNVSGEQVK